jgi:hypothetical protein
MPPVIATEPAPTLLRVIEADPEAVMRALRLYELG